MVNGTWRLDVDRGDPMGPYLTVMNCSEMAIEAMEKGEKEVETIHRLSIKNNELRIQKKSRVNDVDERYKLNEKIITTISNKKDGSDCKQKSTFVTSEDNGKTSVTIKTIMPTINGLAEVVDARRLETGNVMYQELTITNFDTSVSSTTKRWFNRIGDYTFNEDAVSGAGSGVASTPAANNIAMQF